jgi:hypothetical protein
MDITKLPEITMTTDEEKIHQAFRSGQINHAEWANALRYLDGNYRNHNLCRTSFLCAMQGK